ncbi:conserved protein of unknown function [Candidatus Nitrosocosmicus franklandus]|uniref:Uncharacterized protein n=2 Tax=Candidatus Nitrosocosmicus franklandianus TaxID=1798806 RepID=A0A484ICB1_9ARCH|nr:conserved protein of unknown function [Candidatus Nitrosocosmicus franklandus]
MYIQIFIRPDPIDRFEFYLFPVDTHLGIIKIPTDEITDDFGMNITEAVLTWMDRNQVLNSLQKAFSQIFKNYGKPRESEIRPVAYTTA